MANQITCRECTMPIAMAELDAGHECRPLLFVASWPAWARWGFLEVAADEEPTSDRRPTVRVPHLTDRQLLSLRRTVLALGLVFGLSAGGCATSAAPAVETETVGTLVAGSSVYSAPVHATTDIVDTFEQSRPKAQKAPAQHADVEAPEVAPKTDGLTMGGAQ